MNTPPTSIAQLRNFGLVVGAIFAAGFGLLLPWAHRAHVPVWPWVVGVTLASCAILAPARLHYPFIAWDHLGRALGWVNSRIVLNLLFFLIFVPAGIIARMARWDPMKRGFEPDQPSYRVRSSPLKPTDMEKPY